MRTSIAIATVAVVFGALSTTTHAAQTTTPPTAGAAASHDALAGLWIIKPEDRAIRGADTDRGDDRGDVRRRGGGGFPRGGGGGGRSGGRGGGFPIGSGGRGGTRGGNPEQFQAMANYLRTLTGPAPRMTIVVHESSVGITYDDGARLTLDTNNKKVSERAENGLVKLNRKAHWDGAMLVSETEIENGPKIQQRYELSQDGMELRVSTTTNGFGGRGGGKRVITHAYERPPA